MPLVHVKWSKTTEFTKHSQGQKKWKYKVPSFVRSPFFLSFPWSAKFIPSNEPHITAALNVIIIFVCWKLDGSRKYYVMWTTVRVYANMWECVCGCGYKLCVSWMTIDNSERERKNKTDRYNRIPYEKSSLCMHFWRKSEIFTVDFGILLPNMSNVLKLIDGMCGNSYDSAVRI